ncbi:MAG: IS4 family transposase [Planctomycetota bacterium]|nr:IS4 family transposase [Planctomycetota bacterium]
MAALNEYLSDTEIETLCRRLGHRWRKRALGPGVTVRSMVYRGLYPDRSIRATLADLASGDDRIDRPPADASWCEARDRLPKALLSELFAAGVARLERLVGPKHMAFGRSVYIADGSTLSMPDAPALVRAFGRAGNRHGRSRFPVARITFLTRWGVEAVTAYRLGRYRQSEDVQFRALWDAIPGGSICLFDRHFASFYNLAKLPQRGVDCLGPLNACRDPGRLISQGRRLGKNEWLVPLELCPQLRKKYNDPSLPERLWVRLLRVRLRRGCKKHTLWLVTTLTDTHLYPLKRLAELSRDRWGIETRIGSLKTTLQMSVLRSQTAAHVRSEVAAIVLAHNLVWTLIHQAARQAGTPAARISFTGTVQTVLAFSGALRYTPPAVRPATYRRMLQAIARNVNPCRPGRVEPRLVKRDPVQYCFLTIPRDKARQKCLS